MAGIPTEEENLEEQLVDLVDRIEEEDDEEELDDQNEDESSGEGSEEKRRFKAPARAFKMPDVVKDFIVFFNRFIKAKKIKDTLAMYESSFNKLTDRFFKSSPWPPFDAVSPLVDNDELFMLLYKEIYYRHIYSKLKPTLNHRFESWKNYCDLFNYLLERDTPLDVELPEQWLWDMIDEFIYQFQSSCQDRSKLKNKSPSEISMLKENPDVWNICGVFKYLHKFIEKSGVAQRLRGAEVQGGLGSASLYYNLGYFSMIGLLRVNCLVADYAQALKVLEPIDVWKTKGALYTRVTACQITLNYYVGFCYLIMGRYSDTIRTFSRILSFLSRTERHQTRSYQYEQIIKKTEQMYALLAIAQTLCPQHIEENLQAHMKEKYADKIARMQRGDYSAYEDLFGYACPKFVNPAQPQYDDVNSQMKNPMGMQKALFINDVRQQNISPIVRSYLKLYTSIPISKLADFMQESEEDLRRKLVCVKYRTYNYPLPGQPDDGKPLTSSADIDFYIDQDMIHVTNTKVTKRYGKPFVNYIDKLNTAYQTL